MSLRTAFTGVLVLVLAAAGCVSTKQYTDMRDMYEQENAKARQLADEKAQLEQYNRSLRNRVATAEFEAKNYREIAEAAQTGAPGGINLAPSEHYENIPGGVRLKDLTFGPGLAKLTDRGTAALDAIADQLKGKPPFALVVDGHTDNDPISKSPNASNWELSGKRAAAVVDYLVKKGVADPKTAVLRGFGEFRPLGEDKAKNRRVEIYAVPVSEGAAPAPSAPVKTEGAAPAAPPAAPAKAPARVLPE